MPRLGRFFKSRLRNARSAMLAGARRRRVGNARYGGRRTQLKGFNSVQSRSIMNAIGHSDETKYIATQIATNSWLDAPIHTPGTDILPLVPVVTPGTGEFQRVGRKITPTKCRVDINLSFPQYDLGSASPDVTASQANAIYVVMYILRSKTYKCWQQYLGASTPEWNYLLDDGAGNSVPFGYTVTPSSGSPYLATNTQYLQYPIETSHYTQIKKKVVKLTRNQGFDRTAVSGEAPHTGGSYWKGSFTYRLPKLIYDDTERSSSNGFPTNANVMLAVGYAFQNNLWSQDQAGGTSQTALPLLSLTARSHVWYKDA